MNATTYTEPGLSHRLDNESKYKLVVAARSVWELLTARGAIDEDEEGFRHRLSIQACGRRISEAQRGDYNLIVATLKATAGDTRAALHAANRHGTDGKRIALHKLTELLASQGHPIHYAIPYLRSARKTTLEDATSKDLWAAFYRFNGGNKAAAKRAHNFKQKIATKGREYVLKVPNEINRF